MREQLPVNTENDWFPRLLSDYWEFQITCEDDSHLFFTKLHSSILIECLS